MFKLCMMDVFVIFLSFSKEVNKYYEQSRFVSQRVNTSTGSFALHVPRNSRYTVIHSFRRTYKYITIFDLTVGLKLHDVIYHSVRVLNLVELFE
jgi:hypothetical protein